MRKSSHATADRSAHHVPDSRARRRAVKALRFAPTPFGAGGLDSGVGGAQRRLLRDGPVNPASFSSHASNERREPMRQLSITPSITVTIGRQTRLYFAFVTTAPASLDAPSTMTLEESTFSDVVGLAAEPIAHDVVRGRTRARLVLVDAMELAWQRARYRGHQHLFVRADPVLTGLNTLQHWLWQRLQTPVEDVREVH